MTSDDTKDRQLGTLHDKAADLRHDFHAALNHLRSISDDFSSGGEQRWLDEWHAVRTLQEQRWVLDQQITAMEHYIDGNPSSG